MVARLHHVCHRVCHQHRADGQAACTPAAPLQLLTKGQSMGLPLAQRKRAVLAGWPQRKRAVLARWQRY